MLLRLYVRAMTALRDERGDLQSWLPIAMGIVASIVVLYFVMNYLTGNVGGWISTIWQHISSNLP